MCRRTLRRTWKRLGARFCRFATEILMPSRRINPRSNSIVQEYVLPDFSNSRTGFVRTADSIKSDTDQVVYMNNERFCVPEVLFRPSDVG